MASKSKPKNQSSRGRRNELRTRNAQRKRRQNMMLAIGGVVVGVLVIGVIYLALRGQAPVAGEQSFATQGNTHIPFGSVSPVEYNSTPPTSGPHYGNIAAWNIYSEPQRYEQVVHNLEDGGVIVYYQCEDGCPEIVAQLEEIVDPYLRAGRHVLMLPNDPSWTLNGETPHKAMETRIAVAAWRRLLTLDEVDAEQIRAFIERYEGIDNHVRS